jgi:14-3-3 protein epsilon
MTELQELVLCAQLAEEAKRFDSMVSTMNAIVLMKKGEPLNREERRLLCSAWRNVTVRLRKAFKVIQNQMNKTEIKTDDMLPDILDMYLKETRERLNGLCKDVLKMLERYLLPSVENKSTPYVNESRTLYLKIKADYLRYLASFCQDDEKKSYTEVALKAYQEAMNASQKLEVTNVVRLEVALNFSVFYYNIMNSPSMAIEVAKEAYDLAVAKVEAVDEKDEFRDTIEMMKLLRDNLTSWASTDTSAIGTN